MMLSAKQIADRVGVDYRRANKILTNWTGNYEMRRPTGKNFGASIYTYPAEAIDFVRSKLREISSGRETIAVDSKI